MELTKRMEKEQKQAEYRLWEERLKVAEQTQVNAGEVARGNHASAKQEVEVTGKVLN